MERVLVDGTTCVSVADLLTSRAAPSAINIFNLSHLVEALVLHERVVILDTAVPGASVSKRLHETMASFPMGAARIERREVRALLEEHLAIVRPDFEKLKESRAFESSETRREFSSAIEQLSRELLHPFHKHDDLDGYRVLLAEIYDSYRAGIRPTSRGPFTGMTLSKTLLRPMPAARRMLEYALARFWTAPNELDQFLEGSEVFSAYGSVHHYGDPSGGSPFAAWELAERPTYVSFEGGIILRAAFYLIAARLLNAPYKADFLRWPICWRYFYDSSPRELAVEDRLFALAAQYEDRRVNSVLSPLLKTGAVLLLMPLLLRSVLRDARSPDDVMKIAAQIRATSAAERFRTACKTLSSHVTNGEIESAVQDMLSAAHALGRETGTASREVLYALVSVPEVGFDGMPKVTLSGEALAKIGTEVFDWWKSRRFAFVSKVIGQARQAKHLDQEIRRIFGTALSEHELRLLDRLERIDQPSHQRSVDATQPTAG
jgi:hypothetical protein